MNIKTQLFKPGATNTLTRNTEFERIETSFYKTEINLSYTLPLSEQVTQGALIH